MIINSISNLESGITEKRKEKSKAILLLAYIADVSCLMSVLCEFEPYIIDKKFKIFYSKIYRINIREFFLHHIMVFIIEKMIPSLLIYLVFIKSCIKHIFDKLYEICFSIYFLSSLWLVALLKI